MSISTMVGARDSPSTEGEDERRGSDEDVGVDVDARVVGCGLAGRSMWAFSLADE